MDQIDAPGDGQIEAKRGDKGALSITPSAAEAYEVPTTQPIPKASELSHPVQPASGSRNSETASDPKQVHRYCHGNTRDNPFWVYVERDKKLGTFEKRTVVLGYVGVGIAALSLLAAGIAGFFVYHQWLEMNSQTGFMNMAAEQARTDSAASAAATAKQLAIMQGQLTQTQYAERLDQRAWIEFEPILPKPYKNVTELHIYELFPKNVGKTAARNIVVRADNVGENRGSIENTKHPDWIHNMQDKYLFGKFKNSPPLNGGTPVPSVLGPDTVSPIPITYIEQTPQVFPSGYSTVSEIVGRIDYVDEFGVPHWKRFCFYPSDAAGNLASCAAGNDEDRNPEVPPLPTRKPN